MNDQVMTIILSIFASGGFWAFLQFVMNKKDTRTEMLIGLGHDRIVYLGTQYLERGFITPEEYENLYDYLYKPYEKIGGNGSAKRIMEEVKKLPTRKKGD